MIVRSDKITQLYKNEIISLFNQGYTRKDITTKLNVSYTHVQKIVANNCQYKRPNRKRRIKVNDNFFDNIDSEEKAYWLGFFSADGYNSESYGSLELSLQASDLEHLKSFRNSLQCTGNIKKKVIKGKYVSYRLVFNSKIMSKRLAELNCVQAKSLIYEPPKLDNDELERHFIRGLFDADGSLSMGKVINPNTGYFQLMAQLVGTKKTLDFVKQHINKHCPNVNINKSYQKKGKSFNLRITGMQNVINFCHYFYSDCQFFLPRKHEIFIQALNAPYVSDNIRVGSNIGEDCDVDTEITR